MSGENQGKVFSDAMEEALSFRKELIKSGHLIDAEAFCNTLGIRSSELSVGLEDGRFFNLDVNGRQYFPTFYSDQSLRRSEIESISSLLSNLDGSIKWQFFNTPKLTLGGITPLVALAQGRFKDVAFAARGFFEL